MECFVIAVTMATAGIDSIATRVDESLEESGFFDGLTAPADETPGEMQTAGAESHAAALHRRRQQQTAGTDEKVSMTQIDHFLLDDPMFKNTQDMLNKCFFQ